MTAHSVGKWGRAIGNDASPSHVGFTKAWCYLCDAPHGYDECPLTKEQKERAMRKRQGLIARTPYKPKVGKQKA